MMDVVERLCKIQDVWDYKKDCEVVFDAADEIERLRETLQKIADSEVEINAAGAWAYCVFVAQSALQQKESE